MELLHLRDRHAERELVEPSRAGTTRRLQSATRDNSTATRTACNGDTRVAFSARQELNGPQYLGRSRTTAGGGAHEDGRRSTQPRGRARHDAAGHSPPSGGTRHRGRSGIVRAAHRGGVRLDARSSVAAPSARPRPAARRTSSTASTSSRSRTSCGSSRRSTLSPASTRRARSSCTWPRSSSAEKANQYLIRVRKGVEFHNGKTLTIDDVIYSIRRTKNPKLKLFGNAALRRDRPQAASRSSTSARAGSSCLAPT